jgi:plasmid stabilization system protein ParE
MKKYELTKKAKEDLNDIWNYTVDTWSENGLLFEKIRQFL